MATLFSGHNLEKEKHSVADPELSKGGFNFIQAHFGSEKLLNQSVACSVKGRASQPAVFASAGVQEKFTGSNLEIQSKNYKLKGGFQLKLLDLPLALSTHHMIHINSCHI